MNIINQYNGYVVVDTFHLNGELTEGENIADNGGLAIRRKRLITLARKNPHSAPMWRSNGSVSNLPAFYEAFDVKSSDSMYRPDSLRVKIW